MLDPLAHFFSAVCGQNPAHTWAPGGLMLPCCERCTGLYVGAFVAALLQWRLKPQCSNRFLQIHGGFLLLMIPYGYHWLPQGAVLRTITGVLFGFGLVTYLWLAPSANRQIAFSSARRAVAGYYAGVVAALALVPMLASQGGQVVAYTLSLVAFAGAVVLVALVSANVFLGLRAAIQRVRGLVQPGPAT